MKFVLRRYSIAKQFKCPVQPLEFDMDVMGNVYYNLGIINIKDMSLAKNSIIL